MDKYPGFATSAFRGAACGPLGYWAWESLQPYNVLRNDENRITLDGLYDDTGAKAAFGIPSFLGWVYIAYVIIAWCIVITAVFGNFNNEKKRWISSCHSDGLALLGYGMIDLAFVIVFAAALGIQSTFVPRSADICSYLDGFKDDPLFSNGGFGDELPDLLLAALPIGVCYRCVAGWYCGLMFVVAIGVVVFGALLKGWKTLPASTETMRRPRPHPGVVPTPGGPRSEETRRPADIADDEVELPMYDEVELPMYQAVSTRTV